jgi:hypothetical protein
MDSSGRCYRTSTSDVKQRRARLAKPEEGGKRSTYQCSGLFLLWKYRDLKCTTVFLLPSYMFGKCHFWQTCSQHQQQQQRRQTRLQLYRIPHLDKSRLSWVRNFFGTLERRLRIANRGEHMQDLHGNIVDMCPIHNHTESSCLFFSEVGNDKLSHCRLHVDAVFGLEGQK